MGTGAWDNANTANWSTTSGGSGGAAVPTSSDDVTFDSNSGAAATVTIQTAGATCLTLNLNKSDLILTQSGQTLTAAGTFTFTAGTWITNNNAASLIRTTINSGTKTLTLGSSTITASGTAPLDLASSTGMTVTANTATLTMTNASPQLTWNAPGIDWNGLTLNFTPSGTGSCILGSNSQSAVFTLKAITYTGAVAKTCILRMQMPITMTDLTINGDTSVNRVLVQANANIGQSTTTLTVTNNPTITNADFQDVTGAGAGSWDLSAITGLSGDCGGNSGITFTTAKNCYGMVAGNWSSTAVWSDTDGGAGGTRVPLPQDNVFLTVNAAAGTYTLDMPRAGKNIDCTGFTRTFTQSVNTTIYGSLTQVTTMSGQFGANIVTFSGRGNHTLTIAGKTWSTNVTIIAPGGTYTLQDNWSVSTNSISLNAGTFTDNGKNVTSGGLAPAASTVQARALNLSGTWTIAASGNVWSITSTNFTLNMTGTINFTNTTSTIVTFAGGGITYGGTINFSQAPNIVSITGANTFNTINIGGTGNVSNTFTFASNNTITNLNVRAGGNAATTLGGAGILTIGTFTVNPPNYVFFANGNTYIVTKFIANGDGSNTIYMRSTVDNYPYKLNVLAGYGVSFVDVRASNASGSAVT